MILHSLALAIVIAAAVSAVVALIWFVWVVLCDSDWVTLSLLAAIAACFCIEWAIEYLKAERVARERTLMSHSTVLTITNATSRDIEVSFPKGTP